MITPGSVNPLLLASDGAATTPCGGSIPTPSYVIKNSLRFRRSAVSNFRRTPTVSSATAVLTISVWIKRGRFTGDGQYMFSAGDVSNFSTQMGLSFSPTDQLRLEYRDNALTTNAVYRDPSAWMHVVGVIDPLSATSSDKLRLYVNGKRLTSFAVDPTSGISATALTNWGKATNPNGIGRFDQGFNEFDGYLADIYVIDGLSLTANDFGEFDSVNGVWQPKAYAGTYGTNGFWLKFDDAAQIGKDSSGNNNHWTANNIDVAAPGTQATYDLMKDSPVMFDDGTANPPGNYAVCNPLQKYGASSTASLGMGNLYSTAHTGGCLAASTISITNSGKYYCEFQIISINGPSNIFLGFSDIKLYTYDWYWNSDGRLYDGSAWAAGAPTYAANDNIGMAIDIDLLTIEFFKNGVSAAKKSLNAAIKNLNIFPYIYLGDTGTSAYLNFGQRPFKYAPPAGFKALCTTNLPYCDPFVKPDGTAPHNATITVAANEFKYLGYAPTAANGVTWGTQLDKLSNGVKAHTAGTYTITNSGERLKTGLAQGNP